MLQYDGFATLATIDHNKFWILSLCAVAMIFNYIWFFGAFVIARREKVVSIPILATLFWLAGDGTFVAHYNTWFNHYAGAIGQWYVQLFWAALLLTVTFEVLYVVQAIQYGHKELWPSATRQQFTALIIGGAVAAIIVWNIFWESMGDPLAITYFCIANAALPLLYVGVLLRRRTSAGTAPIVWWAFLGMITCWFIALTTFFGPQFRSPWYYAIWVVCTVVGAGVLVAVKRLPKSLPESVTPTTQLGVTHAGA
ncbi:hypothetical protein BOO86_15215 [Mycobacterium sp. CBMA 234]|uniref:hypothetical protein n=1 Tax=Mycolicibacterium sp. CBMA 234 TaxID=1918495 RepID=UPI0012DF1775|nr:hypothetical protein [Mycolicibacterium sp. CBMA 234]MUL65823.1 hypothetical protein [Mycolicibacterium sp. CBMA 234]